MPREKVDNPIEFNCWLFHIRLCMGLVREIIIVVAGINDKAIHRNRQILELYSCLVVDIGLEIPHAMDSMASSANCIPG